MTQLKIQNIDDLKHNYYIEIKKNLSFRNIKRTKLYKTNNDYSKLIKYLENNLKSIICDKPSILRIHIKNIEHLNVKLSKHRKKKRKKLTKKQEEENKFISKLISIFDYDKKVPKVKFIEKLKLNTCPYCNREYIFKFFDSKEKELKTLAHLDHFYSQKDFPYLALSFYNLIPSCGNCNSKFKNQLNFNINQHIHPYEDDFDLRASFSYSFNKGKFKAKSYSIYSTKRISLKLNANNLSDVKTLNTIKTFRLNDIYREHKDIVLELIQKAEIYNESYTNELLEKYEGKLFKNKEDLLKLISCSYTKSEDIHKRPFAKLVKDINDQLD